MFDEETDYEARTPEVELGYANQNSIASHYISITLNHNLGSSNPGQPVLYRYGASRRILGLSRKRPGGA